MKVTIFKGLKDVEVVDRPRPVAGDNDVLLKNLYASICGSDVDTYYNGNWKEHRVTLGGEWGHECISQAVAVGKNVKDIKVGDILYPYPLMVRGMSMAGAFGAFSEYILAEKCVLNKSVYKVPDKISPRIGCMIEPFTVGTHAAKRSNPKPGEHAVVFGAGTIGISASIALQYLGVKVLIADYSDYRLNIAKGLGMEICNNKNEDLGQKARAIFGAANMSFNLFGGTADVNIFIDAVGGKAPIVDQYWRLGKLFSRLVVVGVHVMPFTVDTTNMAYANQALIGSGGYDPSDVSDVFAIMESGKWNIDSMITAEYPITDIVKAIEHEAKVNEALKCIIKY